MDSGELRNRAGTGQDVKDTDDDDDKPMPMKRQNAIRKRRRQGYIVADCTGCNRLRCRIFLVFFLMSLPSWWACFSMPCILQGLGLTVADPMYWVHRFAAFWLVLSLFSNFHQCMFRDPGFINTNPVKPDDDEGRFVLPEMKELKGVDRLHYGPRFCQWCNSWKPPRSHHCSTVDHCVIRMDHFCPFTNTCIGAYNHGNFLLIYFFGYAALTYSSVISAYSLHHILSDRASVQIAKADFMEKLFRIPNALIVGVQLVLSLITFLPTGTYGEDTRKGAAVGSTTIERRLMDFGEEVELPGDAKRAVKVQGGFYNQGFLKNHLVIGSCGCWVVAFAFVRWSLRPQHIRCQAKALPSLSGNVFRRFRPQIDGA